MKWPVDPEACRRRIQDFWNMAWGFFCGVLSCLLLSLIVRNC